MLAPLAHVQLLCSKLLCNVVVRVLVVAEKQSLPNEINCHGLGSLLLLLSTYSRLLTLASYAYLG
jgi:hypothetical protein